MHTFLSVPSQFSSVEFKLQHWRLYSQFRKGNRHIQRHTSPGADLINGRDMGGVNPIIFAKKLEVSRHQIAI
jgi:hypothetical protein